MPKERNPIIAHYFVDGSTHTGTMKMAITGIVKLFNPERGFGFIIPDNGGDDLFVHIHSIVDENIDALREGQRVKFEERPSAKKSDNLKRSTWWCCDAARLGS
jgi:CspA family cold shock protein